MADVRRGRRRSPGGPGGGDGGSDRGQLILVTGLAVAVTLVALVLLLNTVIYTQNLASRGADVDDGAAIEFRQSVVDGVGGVVDAENRAEYENRTLVRRNVTAAIVRLDNLTARYHVERGTVADVEERTVSLTNGTLLRQTNASRAFTSAGNTAAVDWTLAEDVGEDDRPGARSFRLTVSGENLSDTESDAFSVRLANGSETWQMSVYNDSDDDVVVTNGSDATVPDACVASGPEATIDLTAGTVDGTACPELAYPSAMAPYDVSFRNGDRATGTYAVTVRNATQTSVNESNFAGPNDAASPRAVPAVYAAEFEIHFETPTLAFRTTVRVAPGEPT